MQGKHKAGLTKALAIVMGLIIAVLTFRSVVFASFEDDLKKKDCSITVNYVQASNPADLADMKAAGIILDIYKVADAQQIAGYEAYTFNQTDSLFKDVVEGINEKGKEEFPDDANLIEIWEPYAQDAAAVVKNNSLTPVKSGASMETQIGDLETGLYLIIAHDGDDAELEAKDAYFKVNEETNKLVSIAYSPAYEYQFSPLLVAIPMRETDSGYTFNTGVPGEWTYDYEITIKSSRYDRFLDLIITKVLQDYGYETVTCTFKITGTIDGKTVYTNSVGINVDAANKPVSKTVHRVPASATITVTEVYAGASCTPVLVTVSPATDISSEDGSKQNISFKFDTDSDKTAEVVFTNKYNPSRKKGHGIVNTFTWNSSASAQDDPIAVSPNGADQIVRPSENE